MKMPTITEGDTIRSVRKHVMYYKLAYIRATLSVLVVGIVAWQTATLTINGEAWAAMAGFDRFCLIIGIVGLMVKDLMSFLDKTMQRLDPDQPPPKIPDMPVTPSTRPPGQI